MDAPGLLDVVALAETFGDWPAGTTGTVVEELPDGFVMVELVGPDGSALDLIDLPGSGVRVARAAQ